MFHGRRDESTTSLPRAGEGSRMPSPPPSVPIRRLTPLSAWSKIQVQKVEAEVSRLPPTQRKAFLKKSLLLYHPDKALRNQSKREDVPEAQVNEVFLEIKQLYDRIAALER